jgi:hypothetical protein
MRLSLPRLAVAVAAASLPLPLLAMPALAEERARPQVRVPQAYICWETKGAKDPTDRTGPSLAGRRQSCTLPVTLSEPTHDTVAVTYRTEAITAKPDVDYVDVVKAELVIKAGETVGRLVLEIIPDCEREGEEEFGLELVDAVNADLGDERYTRVTIVDDDKPEDC